MTNKDIQQLIRETVAMMGVDVVDVTEEVLGAPLDTPLFTIQTPDAYKLIGKDGIGFDALNHLVVRMILKKNPDAQKIVVDVDGYYKQSLEKIKQKAFFAAERARSFESSIELEPMNSFERLIVHSLFPEGGDIKTHSEGVGKERRVVLTFSKNTT